MLLHRLGRKELIGWVNLELTGYPDDIPVPEYRVLSVQVKGDVTNVAYTYNDQPLPTAHLGEEIQLKLARYGARESISTLEELARKDTQGLSIPIAPEF